LLHFVKKNSFHTLIRDLCEILNVASGRSSYNLKQRGAYGWPVGSNTTTKNWKSFSNRSKGVGSNPTSSNKNIVKMNNINRKKSIFKTEEFFG
jgi:hypothetical protein